MAIKIVENKKEKIKLVRILIGNTRTGKSGIQAPTKTITIEGISVSEIHKKIKEMIENIK